MTSDREPSAASVSPGALAGLIDDVARFGVAAARRVAGWLRPLGIAALVTGVVVWLTLGVALLGERGVWVFASAVLAVVALVPATLLFVNRRRLLGIADREGALRDELHGLVVSLRGQAQSAGRLVAMRDELRSGGMRALLDVAGQVRRWLGARKDTRERSDALKAVFRVAGISGLAVAVASTVLVVLAVPVAVVVAIALWST